MHHVSQQVILMLLLLLLVLLEQLLLLLLLLLLQTSDFLETRGFDRLQAVQGDARVVNQGPF